MRRSAKHFIVIAAVAIALSGCTARQPASAGSEWVGKPRHDLIAALGQPTSATPLIETGGELLIYAKSGRPHYAFETGPDGTVVKAAEIK